MQKLINGTWTDIAGDQLVIGDTYRISVGDGGWEQKTYAPPEQPPAIRTITRRAFMQRLTFEERTKIRKSQDDRVIDIHDDLKNVKYVELDMDETKNGLLYLEYIGILDQGRHANILVDGTLREV